jgi:hypothetical protein
VRSISIATLSYRSSAIARRITATASAKLIRTICEGFFVDVRRSGRDGQRDSDGLRNEVEDSTEVDGARAASNARRA